MAATKIVNGFLREIWREAVPQVGGGAAVDIATGIRISTVQLSKLRARLFVDGFTGAIVPSAVASIVGGLLHVAVGNSAGGTSFTWTLDLQLTHSVQQGLDASAGAQIQIVNGVVQPAGASNSRIVYTAADFPMINDAIMDIPDLSLAVLAGHSYLVKIDALAANATSCSLALGGTATASNARLTHTIQEHGYIQVAPSPTLDPLLLVVATKSDIGDAETVTCPIRPGTIVSALVHWQIEGMILVNGNGDLRLRCIGLSGAYTPPVFLALSTMRVELIA